MTLKNTIFIFVISILLLEQGCVENNIQQKIPNIQYLAELSPNNIPHKEKINIDSLIISTPGKDGMKQPVIISSVPPLPVELTLPDEIIPGTSFLHQSVAEKLARDLPVKSKKPEIIKIDHSKLVKQNFTQYSSPIITTIPQALFINFNNLSSYEEIANESGLVSVQHNDSIFPPISLLAAKPRQIMALPMNYKEDVLFNIRILDADQELPNSFIRAIVKDKRGILWFGTHTGGLVSYNGQFFNHYTKKSGLSSDMILSLLIDKKNNLWIGTQGGGVNHFNGKTITQYTKKQGLPSNNVLDILEDSKGNIWFATTKGVSLFNGETISTYTTGQGLAYNTVTSLCEDSYGNIWFGTNGGGVTKYDGNIFTTYSKKEGLTSNLVLSITKDHHGNLWIGTNGGGVSVFDGHSFTNYTSAQGLGNDVILSIIEDSDDNIWFGTFGNGITRYNGESFSYFTAKEGLSDNYIRTLFKDKNNNLLVGTDGGGVCFFNLQSFTHYTEEQGLSDNLVLSILQDNRNRMWFGAFDRGITIFDESKDIHQKSTFTHITTEHGLANNIVLSSIQDKKGDFWFATYGGGVSKLDGKSLYSDKLKFTNYSTDQGLPDNNVRCVLQDNNDNIWFGTEGGVTKFDGSKFVTMTEKSGLGSDKILNVFQDKDGAFWFGTMGGGVIRLKNDSVTQYTVNQGLGDNTVWSITQDLNGDMWFGTNGGGLTCFNGQSFKSFNTENGLSNDYVFSLITDHNNNIWVGTIWGLTQIKVPDNSSSAIDSLFNNEYVIINYNKMDGLKDLDFYTNSVFQDNMNRLWWGTGKALTFLDLNTFMNNEDTLSVHLNELTINNQAINFIELSRFGNKYSQSGIRFSGLSPFSNNPINLSLSYDLNNITFYFSATHWGAPNRIQYQFRLIGLDKEWSLLTKDNIADYRNLQPGDYSFLLRAADKSGGWSKVTEYPFVIRQPWWLTWWAIIIYIFTFVLVFWFIIRWRVNIVLKQKYVLENLILDRTKELNTALSLAEQATIAKSHFIATMSHEIRTPLNAIMGFTHLVINTNLNSKQEDYLQKIDRSAITLLKLINDILDFSKIEAGKTQLEKVNFDLEVIMNSIIILNFQYTRKKNLEFVININPDVPRFLVGDPLRIEQIINNLCSNAIKFTPSGEIIINIEIDKKVNDDEIYLKVAVTDTGIGISKEQIPFLFEEFKQADNSITREYGGTGLGLTISKSLIEMMDGNIWLESEPGKGTTFFFTCKVGVQSGNTSPLHIIPDELKELDVLVCDNHRLALQSLVTTLQSFSLNVDAVTSVEEVLNKLKKTSYDLLIINTQLQDVNGRDIINLIHEKSDFAIKTIIIENFELDEKGAKHIIDNVDGYISKPCLPSVVLDKVLRVFGMKNMSSNQRNKIEPDLVQIKKALKDCHILLVEDNEINQQVVYELLDRVDVKIDLANNGAAAVKMVLKTNYDIILMDLHMPVMDGYNASAQIRKYKIHTPIIAITADAMETIFDKCDKVGINDIITKPIDTALLYNTLIKWGSKNQEIVIDINKLTHEFNNNMYNIVISDLDIQSGIHRFGDNEELYIKMLRKFILTNDQTCSELRKLIQSEEFEQAQIMVHTLKGESGNIGANKVYELSQNVEHAILNKNVNDFEKQMLLLETSMKKIILETQNYFQETTDKMEVDYGSIKKLIKELIEYLKLKDPKAFDLLDELAIMDVNKSDLDSINKAINSDNLKEAFLLLNKILDNN